MVYIASGDELGPGQVYQVNHHGAVISRIDLPLTGTGIALERDKALVLAVPRDGGHVLRIDDVARVSTVIENSRFLLHPIDVAVVPDSDTVAVSDNISNILATVAQIADATPSVRRKFDGRDGTAQNMSVAWTTDNHLILGTDRGPGIYRFNLSHAKPLPADKKVDERRPLLPADGGVAADPHGPRWAAAHARPGLRVSRRETGEAARASPRQPSLRRRAVVLLAGRRTVRHGARKGPPGRRSLVRDAEYRARRRPDAVRLDQATHQRFRDWPADALGPSPDAVQEHVLSWEKKAMKWIFAFLLAGCLLAGGPAALGAVVQLPTFSHFGVSTTVEVPDSGGGLVGGVDRSASGGSQIGGPLSPWRSSAIGSQQGASSTHLVATIHDFEAMDEALLAEGRGFGRGPGIALPREYPLVSAGKDAPAMPRAEIRAQRQQRELAQRAEWEELLAQAPGRGSRQAGRGGCTTRWSCAGPRASCRRKRRPGLRCWRSLPSRKWPRSAVQPPAAVGGRRRAFDERILGSDWRHL